MWLKRLEKEWRQIQLPWPPKTWSVSPPLSRTSILIIGTQSTKGFLPLATQHTAFTPKSLHVLLKTPRHASLSPLLTHHHPTQSHPHERGLSSAITSSRGAFSSPAFTCRPVWTYCTHCSPSVFLPLSLSWSVSYLCEGERLIGLMLCWRQRLRWHAETDGWEQADERATLPPQPRCGCSEQQGADAEWPRAPSWVRHTMLLTKYFFHEEQKAFYRLKERLQSWSLPLRNASGLFRKRNQTAVESLGEPPQLSVTQPPSVSTWWD